MAVDGAHENVFVSGGAGTSSIVVLDFDGHIVSTITGQRGASAKYAMQANGAAYAYFHTNLATIYRARCVFGGDADHVGSPSPWKYFKFTS